MVSYFANSHSCKNISNDLAEEFTFFILYKYVCSVLAEEGMFLLIYPFEDDSISFSADGGKLFAIENTSDHKGFDLMYDDDDNFINSDKNNILGTDSDLFKNGGLIAIKNKIFNYLVNLPLSDFK